MWGTQPVQSLYDWLKSEDDKLYYNRYAKVCDFDSANAAAKENLEKLKVHLYIENFDKDNTISFEVILYNYSTYVFKLEQIRKLMFDKDYVMAEHEIVDFIVRFDVLNMSVKNNLLEILNVHL